MDDLGRTLRLLAEHPLEGRAIDGTSLRVMLTPRLRFRVVYRAREPLVVVRLLHPRQGP